MSGCPFPLPFPLSGATPSLRVERYHCIVLRLPHGQRCILPNYVARMTVTLCLRPRARWQHGAAADARNAIQKHPIILADFFRDYPCHPPVATHENWVAIGHMPPALLPTSNGQLHRWASIPLSNRLHYPTKAVLVRQYEVTNANVRHWPPSALRQHFCLRANNRQLLIGRHEPLLEGAVALEDACVAGFVPQYLLAGHGRPNAFCARDVLRPIPQTALGIILDAALYDRGIGGRVEAEAVVLDGDGLAFGEPDDAADLTRRLINRQALVPHAEHDGPDGGFGLPRHLADQFGRVLVGPADGVGVAEIEGGADSHLQLLERGILGGLAFGVRFILLPQLLRQQPCMGARRGDDRCFARLPAASPHRLLDRHPINHALEGVEIATLERLACHRQRDRARLVKARQHRGRIGGRDVIGDAMLGLKRRSLRRAAEWLQVSEIVAHVTGSPGWTSRNRIAPCISRSSRSATSKPWPLRAVRTLVATSSSPARSALENASVRRSAPVVSSESCGAFAASASSAARTTPTYCWNSPGVELNVASSGSVPSSMRWRSSRCAPRAVATTAMIRGSSIPAWSETPRPSHRRSSISRRCVSASGVGSAETHVRRTPVWP